jgi:hypothetical protein
MIPLMGPIAKMFVKYKEDKKEEMGTSRTI